MNYLGIWHIPFKEANYICIEPWTSLPSRQNVIIDIECKSDLIKIIGSTLWSDINLNVAHYMNDYYCIYTETRLLTPNESIELFV